MDDTGGSVGRDADRDRSGDQAAWRDLVARLELPSPVDQANPPWPERENLRPAAHARRDAEASDQRSDECQDTHNEAAAGKEIGSVGKRDAPRDPSPSSDSGPAARTPTSPGRVIRPARSRRFPVPADEQSPGAAGRRPGPADLPGLRSFPPLAGLAPAGASARSPARPVRSRLPGKAGTNRPAPIFEYPTASVRKRTRTSATSRRTHRRNPSWTRSPAPPGPRCSAVPDTCSSPRPCSGRCRAGPRRRRSSRSSRVLLCSSRGSATTARPAATGQTKAPSSESERET